MTMQLSRFNACLDILLTSGLSEAKLEASQLVGLPIFSVGHRSVLAFIVLQPCAHALLID